MDLEKYIETFLNENTGAATGCTEPIAVAYATSLAYNAINNSNGSGKLDIDKFESIEIETDRDVYKNALAVNIPNTNGHKGMGIASAMGLFANPDDKLNLLNSLTEEEINNAYEILNSNKVIIKEVVDNDEKSSLDIKVKVKYKGIIGEARIQKNHTNVTEIKLNDKIIFENNNGNLKIKSSQIDYKALNLKFILDKVDSIPMDSRILDLAYEGIKMNQEIADAGLATNTNFGITLGKNLQNEYETQGTSVVELLKGKTKSQALNMVEIIAAAAGDARMGGANYPVMSTSGSGNQSITALLPIMVVGEIYNKSKAEQSKAALVSHMVTRYVTEHSGYLSGLCGCAIKAGIGVTAGIAYMMAEENKEEIVNNAINYLASDITGIICDGAKDGCATKLSTAARQATRSAKMALSGSKIEADNGIIYQSADDTIKGIGQISAAMVSTDQKIVYLMQNKK